MKQRRRQSRQPEGQIRRLTEQRSCGVRRGHSAFVEWKSLWSSETAEYGEAIRLSPNEEAFGGSEAAEYGEAIRLLPNEEAFGGSEAAEYSRTEQQALQRADVGIGPYENLCTL